MFRAFLFLFRFSIAFVASVRFLSPRAGTWTAAAAAAAVTGRRFLTSSAATIDNINVHNVFLFSKFSISLNEFHVDVRVCAVGALSVAVVVKASLESFFYLLSPFSIVFGLPNYWHIFLNELKTNSNFFLGGGASINRKFGLFVTVVVCHILEKSTQLKQLCSTVQMLRYLLDPLSFRRFCLLLTGWLISVGSC